MILRESEDRHGPERIFDAVRDKDADQARYGSDDLHMYTALLSIEIIRRSPNLTIVFFIPEYSRFDLARISNRNWRSSEINGISVVDEIDVFLEESGGIYLFPGSRLGVEDAAYLIEFARSEREVLGWCRVVVVNKWLVEARRGNGAAVLSDMNGLCCLGIQTVRGYVSLFELDGPQLVGESIIMAAIESVNELLN